MNNNILNKVSTPIYICYEELLENNLKTLEYVSKKANVKILLALKAFAYFPLFCLVKKYLHGTCSSGLNEALLSHEYDMPTHTYSPAYKDTDIEQIANISSSIIFNSTNQLFKYKDIVKKINKNISIGLRINPQSSYSPKDIYNPCSIYSRFGITKKEFDNKVLKYIDGFHFHALCEQNSYALQNVFEVFEEKFGTYFNQIKWINFGGGHHITNKNYDIEHLISILNKWHKKYPHLEFLLEPGEGVGLNTGILVASVLDIVHNEIDIAILDTSAEAHMPDVLAMPYRPMIKHTGEFNEKKHNFRLAGNTCLSGDIIGDYSFDKPLKIGDKIIFEDMMHYTNVKNTTFNGIALPSIGYIDKENKLHITKKFGFKEYKHRLG